MTSGVVAGTNEKFKLGICQTHVSKDKTESLEAARDAVVKAVSMGAEVVVLGEMFSCPYATKFFKEYGERLRKSDEEQDPSVKLLSTLARENKIWLVGGSIPELEDDRVYNTCLVFNPDGELVAKHRKAHLFDIDVAATEGRPAIKFMESDVLSPGESVTLVDLPWCRVGLGICYDIRFPEYALALRNRGAKLLIYPGAFNMNTGPAHWSLLARARAVDAQSYVALVSPARSADPADYQAWGHSMVVNPWGEVKVEAENESGVWVVEVDPVEADRIRGQVPTTNQKRQDLYVPYADDGRAAQSGLNKRAKTES
eukprot:TRINITY_DN10013_c0_g2_i1.p1 TRINITY_DN10013_c0_g2~~TRINITY_DN10013_c0_g2_i1.p1  ORF type:complete len:330 (-),score=46.10 TRINITY_DN10013_c0_g2_i1:48-986(-)